MPLIPRATLFGNPEKISPAIAPDGKTLAYIAPDEGVLNVWVRVLGRDGDRVVTRDRKRGIRAYGWAQNSRHLLYIQDKDGDENWHLHAVDLETGEIRDLSPFDGVRVEGIHTDHNFPGQVVFGMNKRDPSVFDLYRCDLNTAEITPEVENPGHYVQWILDHNFRVRGAAAAKEDGGFELHLRADAHSPFTEFLSWGPEESQNILGFTPDGRGLYLEDSVDVDTTQLYEIDIATRVKKVLASDPAVDLGAAMVHQTRHHVQAVSFEKERREWKVLDPDVAADFDALAAAQSGQFMILSRDLADRTWLVEYDADVSPARYYSYDRATKQVTFLFAARPALETARLATMKPQTIRARDGLNLVVYLTTPAGVEPKNLPMVLNVHGGPWVRDDWGYHPEAQWFANRGYACLQVNYRGSTGFGKKFMNAGNREWGAKMHDDLIDAVNWAVAQGIADPKKVCIYGGSYGGYAALVGAAFTPDFFAAAIDIVGPSNIITLLNSIPPYWAPMRNIFRVRVGDLETEQEFLESRSPLFKAGEIRIPMLIAQGANDPRVKQAEAEQIVEALRAKGKPVEYLLFADEGHGFARPENRMAFYAAAEAFLAQHLGGSAEPPSTEEEALLGTLRK